MSLIIKNASLLLGQDLTFVTAGFVEIGKYGIIKKARAGNYYGSDNNRDKNVVDAEGFLLIPGFINAHTHIGDSIGKDIAVDFGLDTRVHPVFGVKKEILQKSKSDHLKTFIRGSALSMMKKGITAFADFREGGIEGVKLLKTAISDLPIRCVILGRVEYYLDPTIKGATHNGSVEKNSSRRKLPSHVLQSAAGILKIADGLGISGANENTDESLQQYRKLLLQDIGRREDNNIKNRKRKKKGWADKDDKKLLIAIHAAESKKTVEFSKSTTGKTEVDRIMQYLKPDIIVHMTNVTDEEISIVAKTRTGIIVCPRANGILAAGVPKVAKMLRHGCKIGIGTDNVMLNSPDIFRELEYTWKVSRSTECELISAKDVLKMSTVNNAEILGLNSGYIGDGRLADLIFINKNHIDLYPIHNPYASIVHRASQDSIKAVMINGRFVDGVDSL